MLNNPIFSIDRSKQKGSMGWASSPACVVPSIAENFSSSVPHPQGHGAEAKRAYAQSLSVHG